PHRRTLVTGSAGFPDEALEDGSDGHVLDLVFVSEDIEPSLVGAQLWLPSSGASAPFADGRPGEAAASLLPFRTVSQKRGTDEMFEGRLSIYYANTVLQSATVRGALAAEGTASRLHLDITVDYAVTGSYLDIAALGSRELRRADGGVEKLTVGLSLVQNGSATRHRIIAKGSSVPAKWRNYDPQGNTAALALARNALVSRFVNQGLDRNAAAYEADLDALVTTGASLYAKAFGSVEGSSNPDFVSYLQSLGTAIRSKTVIQIATSGLTQYVFPWALLYDYPMDRADKRIYCKLVKNGEWTAPPQSRCPYDDEPWHEANVLCPYGFWGFRNIVEQPLSELPSDKTDVLEWGERKRPRLAGPSVVFTAGVTRDPAVTNAVDAHLQSLASLGTVTPAGGVVQWSVMEQNMRAAELLYFLCHGRRDAARLESYIEIGATGDTLEERIYPSILQDWARRRSNVPPALQNAPLVMINGCHTAELTADDLVNFVQSYAGMGASGVIGTEVSVPVDFAAAFGFAFLEKLTKGKLPVGQAMYDTRWDFARRGNLLGLIYTPYCFADLGVFS
ncbi:MAG: CHAT domain-containing protein, partial [Candidatus Eremiobacteraeota bacterium]|nr:CHAT domain-containing protein [Candidatus Eremiobacteraeota bacterium]